MDLTKTTFIINKNVSPLFESSLTAADKAEIINNAVSLIAKEYRTIPMSLYRDYELTENRMRYKKAIEERTKDLASLLFAEYYEDKERFIPSIIDLLYLICGEPAWWLPAHNLYSRDTETEAFPDTTRPIICLNSAETSALLAITMLLLGEKLPSQCRKHVSAEIRKRTLRPYESSKFWWMGGDGEHLNNWTPWCIQNILICYLIVEDDEDLIRKGIEKSLRSLTLFISGYHEDGACEEGAEYYHHAALTFMGSMFVLNLLTDNAFDYIYELPLISNMLDYIRIVHVSGCSYLNIGDCNQILDHSDLKPYFFADCTGNAPLKEFIAHDWSNADIKEQLMISSRYAFDRILTYSIIGKARQCAHRHTACDDGLTVLSSTNLYIYRKAPFTFALNCANNGVSHNHNDSGSFILYKNDEAVFIDVGVETYTKKTFSPERYSIWTMQDKFHNLTVFDGISQHTGTEYQAKVIKYDSDSISTSMLPAYQTAETDRFYERKIRISGEGITITDKTNVAAAHSFVLMCRTKPIEQAFGLSVGSSKVFFESDFSITEIHTSDERLLISYPDGVLYKIEIPYKDELEILVK